MISIQDICIQVGAFSLQNVSFDIESRRFAVLMGATGSGKTTILEAICGLRRVASGRIVLLGEDVTDRKPAERGIGYVPQDGALFTTMSVRENIAFALRVRGWDAAAVDERVREMAELLGIAHLIERRPFGLSGGERQRVALGRALAFRPGILLLDEPLSALDEDTRRQMYHLLRRVREHEHVTLLQVTHSTEDAKQLADRILRLEDGKVSETVMSKPPIQRGSSLPSASREPST